jgi:uncharacterized membrane protein YfcA
MVLALSVVAGILLALLGGGGSILMVPILAYVAGLPARQAVAGSLLVVGVSAAVGMLPHLRAGRVQVSTGITFGSASMLGAVGGAVLSRYVPGPVLMLVFSGVVLMAARSMWKGRPETTHARLPHVATMLAAGVAVGVMTGMVGAGGGFAVVPALVLLGGLPMETAVGTSLLIIALNSGAALAGHLLEGVVPFSAALPSLGAALVGIGVGSWLGGRVPAEALRRAFAVFMVVMALLMGARELSALVADAGMGAWVPWLPAGTLALSGVALWGIRRQRAVG